MMLKQTEKIKSLEISIIPDEFEKDNSKWDEFVFNHPDSSIYHLLDWLKILHQETHQKVLGLVCLDEDNEIVGILPLQYTQGFPFGLGGIPGIRRLSSLPRTPLGGQLALNKKIESMLLQKAVDIVKKDLKRSLQIKSFSRQLKADSDIPYCCPWREIYITEIPEYPNEIRFGDSLNHASIKRAIKKALKNGVQYREADSINDLENWHKLYLETMRFHATPARKLSFFKNIWNSLRPKGIMSLVVAELYNSKDKQIIAGNVLFKFGDTVTYAYSGSNRNHFEMRPNDLLHWETLNDAQRKGFKYYDLGEVSKNHHGLAAYKKKWAISLKEIYHHYYPKIELKVENIALDSSKSITYKQRIWQMLPLKLTEFIGEKTYRYL